MTSDLPLPLKVYFEGTNGHDPEAALQAFAEAARVQDESKCWEGRPAILSWLRETISNYRAVAKLRNWDANPGGFTVAASVTGNFPGSPLNLNYSFHIEGGQIVFLEIA